MLHKKALSKIMQNNIVKYVDRPHSKIYSRLPIPLPRVMFRLVMDIDYYNKFCN